MPEPPVNPTLQRAYLGIAVVVLLVAVTLAPTALTIVVLTGGFLALSCLCLAVTRRFRRDG
ncbi:hypothetical protein ACFQGT_07485 [Natrialbaceae archaeon GCM10025810]|uniref:hypothetical protein n=1 Tax=Halovalidus salilacus TaxID=3075124 RepID=UPI0036117B2F